MAINAFIPEVWASELLSSLKKATVLGSVCNRSYEGQIQNAGDTVRITSVARPTVADYVVGTTTITPEQLTDAQRSLVIDQAKYFAFEIDDVDAAQSVNGGALMSEAAAEAAYALRDAFDQYLWSFYTEAASANQESTVSVTTGALAYTQIRKLALNLDEANVPTQGRWLVAPPWFTSLLLEESKFVEADKSGTTDALRNGFIGRALGFDLLQSNNSPLVTGDDYAVMAGHPMAITVAEQITKVEAYRPQDSFSDALKGLHVYGAKVVRPDAITTVLASQT